MKFIDEDVLILNLIKSEVKNPCIICKELTMYKDYYYEMSICSKDCLKHFNLEIAKMKKNTGVINK